MAIKMVTTMFSTIANPRHEWNRVITLRLPFLRAFHPRAAAGTGLAASSR